MMKAEAMRQKSVDDLKKLLLEFKKELFKLRMQRSMGGETMSNSHLFKRVRANIARVKTILSEMRERGAS